MNESKRQTLKSTTAILLLVQLAPDRWSKPVISRVILPAHAMTSGEEPPAAPEPPDNGTETCSAFETEPVDEPIAMTVTATEVRGPIVASLSGTTFSAVATSSLGPCGDAGDVVMQTIEFDGEIDSAQNSIRGNFIIRQRCGGAVVCDQVTTYSAVPDSNSDLGDYAGRATGTLTCCVDFF